MRMNRRNVLVGLGTIVAGGGAALGTGAFSSVEAERTVTVNTAGDGAAYLGISVSSSYATDGTADDTVEIDLGVADTDSGFNDNATTKVAGVLTITNNEADSNDVRVSLGDTDGHSQSETVSIDGADVTFTLSTPDTNSGTEEDYTTISSGSSNSTTIDAEVDTTVDNSGTDTENLTLYATDTQ